MPLPGVSRAVDGFVFSVMSSQGSITAPADSTTHYIGALGLSTLEGINKIRMPKAGRIKKVYLIFVATVTQSSNETSTISIRLNATTDTVISSSIVCSATINEFSNTAMNVAVAVDDYIELKWVTPAWATNPTGLYIVGQIYMV